MWCNVIIFASSFLLVLTEITVPGIDRIVSDGVTSKGFKVVYGDEDMAVINEVVDEAEKSALKNKVNINQELPPLPAEDVKCLMSVDRYCSKEMGQIKGILVQALKDDCTKCSESDKDKAGKVVASMMAHDPVAWKLFLTRYNGQHKVQRSALQIIPRKETKREEELNLRLVGEPEEVVGVNKYTRPGFKVRVKRYQAEPMP